MKHTPGPWRFDGHGINSNVGERICKVQHVEQWDHSGTHPVLSDQFYNDSCLIATSPELLQALRATIVILSMHKTIWMEHEEELESYLDLLSRAEGV